MLTYAGMKNAKQKYELMRSHAHNIETETNVELLTASKAINSSQVALQCGTNMETIFVPFRIQNLKFKANL